MNIGNDLGFDSKHGNGLDSDSTAASSLQSPVGAHLGLHDVNVGLRHIHVGDLAAESATRAKLH